MDYPINSIVRLCAPIQDLRIGRVGVVTECLDTANLLIEFSNEDGTTQAMLPVNVANLVPVLSYAIVGEAGRYAARCLAPDASSEGDNEEDALAKLKDVLELRYGQTLQPEWFKRVPKHVAERIMAPPMAG